MEHWHKLRNRVLALLAMLSAIAAPATRSGHAQDGADEEAWQRAQVTGTADAYEGYLRRFPLGRYTREAYRCAVISAAREQAPEVEVIDGDSCGIAPAAGPTSTERSSPDRSAAGAAGAGDSLSATPLGRVY